MREMLFRVKLKVDNGEHKKGDWAFGDLVRIKDGEKTSTMIYGFGEVDPSTVGQYTGLTDKNGKKIFEGDIIKWGLKPCVVKWDECNASFCLYVYGIIKISGFNRDTMKLKEVIGNIHDNPELMKGAEQ